MVEETDILSLGSGILRTCLKVSMSSVMGGQTRHFYCLRNDVVRVNLAFQLNCILMFEVPVYNGLRGLPRSPFFSQVHSVEVICGGRSESSEEGLTCL